ncbi:MAG: hypothetical protein P8N50_10095, partial [Actinomycetota bacterium]|nr:hypothetical protein [Actinomycetota bacterium]
HHRLITPDRVAFVEQDTVMAEAAHLLVSRKITGRIAYSQQILAEYGLGPDPADDMVVDQHPRAKRRPG